MASFGENLRRERELRGIKLAEIAAATKIGTRFLQAIEEDRLEILPGGMFPRAFVRQYASFLGLDVERTVADFVRACGARWVDTPRPPKRRSRDGWGTAVFLLGMSLLGLGLLVMRRPQAQPRLSVAPPIAVGAGQAVLAEAADLVPAAGLVLQLRAERRCWVEAYVDGRVVTNRVLLVGEAVTLEAADEILLSVGNAGGLAVSLNGQAGVPLGREGAVRRNIHITRETLASFIERPITVASSRSS